MKRTHRHQVQGKDIDVESEQLVSEGGHVVEVCARCGEHEHRHRVTIGAEGEPLPDNYDAAQLAKDLQKAREHAARMAESKDRKSKLIAHLFND
jgi:hypothetical protein